MFKKNNEENINRNILFTMLLEDLQTLTKEFIERVHNKVVNVLVFTVNKKKILKRY
jgi:hypothetical protein